MDVQSVAALSVLIALPRTDLRSSSVASLAAFSSAFRTGAFRSGLPAIVLAVRLSAFFWWLCRPTSMAASAAGLGPVKPGVYRVSKPWEMNGQQPVGCGLLAKMGLATFESYRVEMNPTPRALSDIKQGVSIK